MMSKTSRKLAKYSAAKYLQKQGATRINSDMMSLDTDQCLHASADSLASTGSGSPGSNPNGHCAGSRDVAYREHGRRATPDQTPSPPTSTIQLSHKKMSISISTARTTTTSLTAASNCSDQLSNCSNYGASPAVVGTGTTSSGGQSSIRFLSSCSRADPVGYSIITEEGSSSSSTAQPLTSSIRCVENDEPEVNEHSPLPPLSTAVVHCAVNGSVGSSRSELVQQLTNDCQRCSHQRAITSEPFIDATQSQVEQSDHHPVESRTLLWNMNSSLPNGEHQAGVCVSARCEASHRAMSLSLGASNDANQSKCHQSGHVCLGSSCPPGRYRAHSNECIANMSALGIGHPQCALSCGDSVGAATALVGANRINNDPSVMIVTDSDLLASDSNLIAIDTNYCQCNAATVPGRLENGHSSGGPSGGAEPMRPQPTGNSAAGPLHRNDFPGDASTTTAAAVPLTSNGHAALDSDKSVQVLKCNHSLNGDACNHPTRALHPAPSPSQATANTTANVCGQQQPVEPSNNGRPAPPASIVQLANHHQHEPRRTSLQHSLQLKEDSSSSTASASASHHAPNQKCSPLHAHHPNHHSHHKDSRHRSRPLKPSSQRSNHSSGAQTKLHHKESVESKRERKAAKTLAIITGRD